MVNRVGLEGDAVVERFSRLTDGKNGYVGERNNRKSPKIIFNYSPPKSAFQHTQIIPHRPTS